MLAHVCPLVGHVLSKKTPHAMSLWYLKAIELHDGRWECRFGREDLGTRPTREAALYLLAAAATLLGGREIFGFYLYHRDGRTESLDAAAPLPGEDEVDAPTDG